MLSLVRKISACFAFIICYIWYARCHFYRDPGSAFFDKARAYEEKYTLHRKAQTRSLIDFYQSSRAQQGLENAGGNASLCVALTSVKRESTQYLEVCRQSTTPRVILTRQVYYR